METSLTIAMWKILEDPGEVYTMVEDAGSVHTCVEECERPWNMKEKSRIFHGSLVNTCT